jgi:hypothetical protein
MMAAVSYLLQQSGAGSRFFERSGQTSSLKNNCRFVVVFTKFRISGGRKRDDPGFRRGEKFGTLEGTGGGFALDRRFGRQLLAFAGLECLNQKQRFTRHAALLLTCDSGRCAGTAY